MNIKSLARSPATPKEWAQRNGCDSIGFILLQDDLNSVENMGILITVYVLGCVGIEHCQGPLLCDQMTMPALVATRETVCTRRTSNDPNLSCQRQGIIEKGIILISKSLRSYHWTPTNITVPERYNSTTTNVMLNAILIKIPTFFTK